MARSVASQGKQPGKPHTYPHSEDSGQYPSGGKAGYRGPGPDHGRPH